MTLNFFTFCLVATVANTKLTGNGGYDVFWALDGMINDTLSWYYKADSCGFVQEICPGNQ